jgi:hypothetical protein
MKIKNKNYEKMRQKINFEKQNLWKAQEILSKNKTRITTRFKT